MCVRVCVCVCVWVCVRACVRVCVRVCMCGIVRKLHFLKLNVQFIYFNLTLSWNLAFIKLSPYIHIFTTKAVCSLFKQTCQLAPVDEVRVSNDLITFIDHLVDDKLK